jgi:pimeloyl-ACP methyl ester carboxylesterase
MLTSIWRKLYEAGDLGLLAEFLAHAALSAPALEALSADPEVLRTGLDAVARSAAAGTPEQTELLGRIDVQADLAQITVPTLVIVTTADSLVPPPLQRELAAAIPGARTAEIATGHLPFAENPVIWLELMTTFLDRQSAPRP